MVYNKLNNMQFKLIKIVRNLVFIAAMLSLISGMWILCSEKNFSSRSCLALVLGASIMTFIYIFNKELEKNKIDGIRAIAYFLSLGKPIFFSLALYGIMQNDSGLIILFVSLGVVFVFLPTLYTYSQNRLKGIRDKNFKKDD